MERKTVRPSEAGKGLTLQDSDGTASCCRSLVLGSVAQAQGQGCWACKTRLHQDRSVLRLQAARPSPCPAQLQCPEEWLPPLTARGPLGQGRPRSPTYPSELRALSFGSLCLITCYIH